MIPINYVTWLTKSACNIALYLYGTDSRQLWNVRRNYLEQLLYLRTLKASQKHKNPDRPSWDQATVVKLLFFARSKSFLGGKRWQWLLRHGKNFYEPITKILFETELLPRLFQKQQSGQICKLICHFFKSTMSSKTLKFNWNE